MAVWREIKMVVGEVGAKLAHPSGGRYLSYLTLVY